MALKGSGVLEQNDALTAELRWTEEHRSLPADKLFGLVADLSLHFQFLSGLTTFPRRPVAEVNVTERRADNEVALSAELRRRIEALNAEDCALFAAVEAILALRRAEMAEFVERRRAYFVGEEAA